MTKKEMEDLALFRFSLIAPIINGIGDYSSKEEFFREVSKKPYSFKEQVHSYSPGTIKDWYHKYRINGLDGLMPKARNDSGTSRNLSPLAKERIFELKKEFKFITGTSIYHTLISEGLITSKDSVSLSTVLRFIKKQDLKKPTIETELKAFAFKYANDSWQADTSWLFNISVDGKSYKTCIIAFLDDASRKVVGADIYFNDSSINVQKTLKKAIAKFGIPKRLHLDNGASYKNHQLALICARLGISQIFCQVRKASSKGKVERFFNTLKTTWLATLKQSQIKSLADFQGLLDQFIHDYNSKTHSTINSTPNDRFKVDQKLFKYTPIEKLDKIFLNEINRRVNNDSTVQIENNIYEVPSIYIKDKITIKYNPDDLSEVYIYDKDEYISIKKLNREENTKVKRNQIDFVKLNKGVNSND